MTGSATVLFLAAFAVRMLLVWRLALYAEPFRGEIQRTAVSLATLGVYGNGYAVPTGPTAHVAPLYTLMLAGVFRVFGAGMRGEIAILTLNAMLAAAVYAMLPAAARRLGFPTRVGLAAAWLGALLPFHYLNEFRAPDSQVAALALMGIVVAAVEDTRRRAAGWRYAAARGALWGAALLVLPTLVGVILALVLGQCVLHRASVRWRSLLGSAIVALLVVSPWAIRNTRVLGAPVWTRSNLGIEMRVAFNDAAWPDIDRNRAGGAWDLYHPSASAAAAVRLRDEGETEYNRRLLSDARLWIQQHPARALELVAQRTLFFWLPYTQRPLQRLFLSGLSLAAFLGLYLLFRQREGPPDGAVVIAIVWTVFPLVYYLTQAAVRYRYPMVWTLLLTSAFAFHCAFRRAASARASATL